MGIEFGNLEKVRHVITYSLSPFEQRAFPNFFTKSPLNVWRRFRSQVLKVAPPFVVAYVVYAWGTDEFQRLKRKNPADFENDQ
uniref:Cytochrome b-c1 complex subunit 8 n=1 Tax=Pelusios castaneus TaxID=367368 RepID=A0A8C8RQ99_9SAUR